ncbi:MAG: glycine--tRNA ligase subunit beta [Planctomycetes bacterium]|nr:glycine--tRNA ligase subunit beta [Planctomycetota bacterium]
MLSFQDIIQTLQRYWAERGCLLWYPYHETVGAGTANPATTLRVLGPEPWKVAYLEPSFRPDDGRYGDNPNRLQMHHQFQVILKPIPENAQELYLGSLVALGIRLESNDVRFVEDNWESPALGAWGLGWEVWLNGMEVSQYTYFQQAGGRPLDPTALELTYGLERIAMALNGVESVWDLPVAEGLTYREVYHRAEVEHCVYNFEVADVDRLRELFKIAEGEADACLQRGLVVPAHDQVLRCSHAFNQLDSRGAIGVTERAQFFARMRNLSRRVADAYRTQREEAGLPLLKNLPAPRTVSLPPLPQIAAERADLLLEIGVEELPADDVDAALAALGASVEKLLEESRLGHRGVRVLGTPRRLAVIASELATRQADHLEELKGPPVKVAKDASGALTKAGAGFEAKSGVPFAQWFTKEEKQGQLYYFANAVRPGRSTAEVLAEALPKLVDALPFKKSMRWLCTAVDGERASFDFSRPLRWVVCLLGEQVLPLEIAGVVSERETRGLRDRGTPRLAIARPSAYESVLREAGIEPDPAVREREIRAQAAELARGAGGVVRPEHLEALVGEVRQMVERPVAFLGRFEERFLTVPDAVLVTVMKSHQRYFPVTGPDGKLRPCFIGVRNAAAGSMEQVVKGNEAVLRARFADASFFFENDCKQRLEEWRSRLSTLAVHEKLGSYADKVQRLEQLCGALANDLGVLQGGEERVKLVRAAQLAKADMVTRVVTEFSYLAGTMGAVYAARQGEAREVVEAIEDQYKPLPGSDVGPRSTYGLVLGLADRLDKLIGFFALGIRPTGAADPFALRRDALGILLALESRGARLSLRAALRAAAQLLPVPCAEAAIEEAAQFVEKRLEVLARERSLRPDVVDAAIAASGDDPVRCLETMRTLAERVASEHWSPLLTSYARCKRIARKESAAPALAKSALREPAELALAAAYEAARAKLGATPAFADVLDALDGLTAPIDAFFTAVMVMADDPALRAARLGLVACIAALPDGHADLSRLEGF